MEQTELDKAVELHGKWWRGEKGGVRIDLSGADLSGAYFSDTNLSGANLSGANLSCANLSCANLRGANLRGANLSNANLRDVNLSNADLRGANLSNANLRDVNLSNADLRDVNLSNANLNYAKNIPAYVNGVTLIATDEIKTGWKKLADGLICKIEIPAEAKRSNATGRKCRCEYAKVIEIWNGDESVQSGVSSHYRNFQYKVGEIVRCDKWNDNRWAECSGGIHFFLTRVEAECY